MKLERPLVSLDLETSGPDYKRDRIVQIGVLKVFPDGHEKEWETLVNPMCHIPPEIVKIHGITNAMVEDECPFEVIAPGFQQAVRDCDICGYNVMFDLRLLKSEYQRLGKSFIYGKVVDPFKIYQKFEKRDLTSAVRYYLNEELKDAHSALPDARAAYRVLEAQLKRYPQLPDTVNELHTLLFDTVPEGYMDPEKKIRLRNGKPCINFGKQFVGVPLENVSNRYLNWMLSEDFSDRVKELVKEVLNARR